MSLNSTPPPLYRNWISYGGALLAISGLVLDLVLFARAARAARTAHTEATAGYTGFVDIVACVLVPSVMTVGLLAVLAGMRITSTRRMREGKSARRTYPSLDLNDPKQRRFIGYVAALGLLFLVVFSYAGYRGYAVTESVEFCGKACHTQMEPEYVAHQRSSHARVPCVECHVGSGLDAFMTSKKNGAEQLLGVLSGHYARPIPTPAKDLPPARHTCETCHSGENIDERSWGAKVHQRAHFDYDEASSPDQIVFFLRPGSGTKERAGTNVGTHWHRLGDEVMYAATDGALQDIPWVRVKRADGSATEYVRAEKKSAPAERAGLAGLTKHTMDCVDCHNRPGHAFEPPDVAVDRALAQELMPRALPWAKSLSVDLLTRDYPSRDAAHDALTAEIREFYARKHPDVATARAADVDALTAAVLTIYDANVFPNMRASWKTYPSNLGHRDSAGCFRCHDGKHVASDGKALTGECDACHSRPQRGARTPPGVPMESTQREWHPWQTPEKHLAIAEHSEILCHECHVAGRRPKTECNECHSH
jgi:hypothetical protein